MFDLVFPDGLKRGMAFDSVLHAKNGCYLTPNGSMITRKDWQRMKRLALDDLPESVRAPHVPSASDDAEARVGMLKHILRGYGLDDDSITEACDICRKELAGEVTDDELPASGPGGARNLANSRSREGGEEFFKSPGHFERRPPLGTKSSERRGSSVISEQEFRSSPASDASFDQRYPGVRERLGRPVHGTGQYDETLNDRRSRRQRQLAADAVLPDAGDRLSQKFPGIENVKVGDWAR